MDQKLSDILESRGYVYQISGGSLAEITDGPKRTLYWGVDPSADSMHVGQLQGMLIMRHFLEAGHTVIFLAGGATGMIGDPGGKNEERPLLDVTVINENVKALEAQAQRLLNSEAVEFVNNIDWLGKIGLLDFLRDTGKYETVNAMIKREMVRDRIQDPDRSISYAEFSYMLLQAHDFWHLFTTRDVELQVGASDQWGNIISGVDLIKHKTQKVAFAYTWPLLVNKATGKKFGKSEGGAIWLDPHKTSPFQFYQFWLNTEDDAVEEYLRKMTLVSLDEIAVSMAAHTANPENRIAQKKLAETVTTLVHGSDVTARVQLVSAILFAEIDREMTDNDWKALFSDAPHLDVSVGSSLVDVLVESTLASSKREAREFIENGAITLNDVKITDPNHIIVEESFNTAASMALLKRGKRTVSVLVRS